MNNMPDPIEREIQRKRRRLMRGVKPLESKSSSQKLESDQKANQSD